MNGKIHQLDVESSDTIDQIKVKLQQLADVPPEQQRLLHGGKQLEDGRTLSDYGIMQGSRLDLILRQRRDLPIESTIPSESVTPDRDAVKASAQAWKTKAEKGVFDDDICIIDPQAHYMGLSYLEKDVVETSEFFHSQGTYNDAFSNRIQALTLRHHGLKLVPDWMWAFFQLYPADIAHSLTDDFGEHWKYFQEILASLWTSYFILCRVLTSFDILSQADFCTSYYSILLEQFDNDIAEIVKVPRDILDNVKTGIEAATTLICNGGIHPEEIHTYLRLCVEEPCSQLLDILHLPASESSRSIRSILAVCRTMSLVADLGLVSYVGSHATRFDFDYLHKEISGITVNDGDTESIHFDCRLKRLACLNGFLDEEKVWVFRCSTTGSQDILRKEDSRAELLILTHIEEFADIWGPVWSIPADPTASGLIQRYNVSKGVICRVDEAETQRGKAVRCHWYSWDSFQRRRRTNALLSLSKPLYLERDDLLLIGTRFRENEDCKYTLDQFEGAYGHDMGVLGGERSVWEPEFDSRSGSFSFSKIIGVSVSGTQKKRPQTSLKQLILARWKTTPQTANPGILNQYLGVEISHCTGNARRVRIKDLLLMPTIWSLLELYFPRWSSHSWGSAFLTALQSSDPRAVFDVWVRYESKRSEMAALVCYVLETLDKTGKREDGLAAAFLNNQQESSVLFDHHCNDWSSLLRDSHLMATYAIVNNICIECNTPDHSTATCDGDPAYTVLETRLGLGAREVPDLVKVQPHGQIIRTLERVNLNTFLMMPGSSASTAGAYLLSNLPSRPVASGVEIRDMAAKGGQQYKIFLRSSNKSHGGMRASRERVQSCQAQPAQRHSQISLPNASSGTRSLLSTFGLPDQPRSASATRSTDCEEVLSGSSTRLRGSDSNLHPQVHIDLLGDPTLNQEARSHSPLHNSTSTPSPITTRLLPSAISNMSGVLYEQPLVLDYRSGTGRDDSSSHASLHFPSRETFTHDAAPRILHPNICNRKAIHARSEMSDRPSLLEDIENYQMDDSAETPSPRGLLYDLNNYRFDDEMGEEADPSIAKTAVPGTTNMTGPSTTNAAAVEPPGTITRLFQKWRRQDRHSS